MRLGCVANISRDVSLIHENIKKATVNLLARQHTVVHVIKNKYSDEDDERDSNDDHGMDGNYSHSHNNHNRDRDDGNDGNNANHGNNANVMAAHLRDVSLPIYVKKGEKVLLGIKNNNDSDRKEERSSDEHHDMNNNHNNNHNHNNCNRDRRDGNGGNNANDGANHWIKLINGDSKNMDNTDRLNKIIKMINNGNAAGIDALSEWLESASRNKINLKDTHIIICETVSQYFVTLYYNALPFDDKSSIICLKNVLMGLPHMAETDILNLFRKFFKLFSLNINNIQLAQRFVGRITLLLRPLNAAHCNKNGDAIRLCHLVDELSRHAIESRQKMVWLLFIAIWCYYLNKLKNKNKNTNQREMMQCVKSNRCNINSLHYLLSASFECMPPFQPLFALKPINVMDCILLLFIGDDLNHFSICNLFCVIVFNYVQCVIIFFCLIAVGFLSLSAAKSAFFLT